MHMIDLGFEFDPAETESVSGFTLLPPGDYNVQIGKVEVVAKPESKMLVLEFITDTGATVFGRYNYIHKNGTAVKIARSDMKAIFEATNIGKTRDVGQLEGKRLNIRVIQKMGDSYTDKNGVAREGRMKNEINGYYKHGQELAPMPVESQSTATETQKTDAPVSVKKNPFA